MREQRKDALDLRAGPCDRAGEKDKRGHVDAPLERLPRQEYIATVVADGPNDGEYRAPQQAVARQLDVLADNSAGERSIALVQIAAQAEQLHFLGVFFAGTDDAQIIQLAAHWRHLVSQRVAEEGEVAFSHERRYDANHEQQKHPR